MKKLLCLLGMSTFVFCACSKTKEPIENTNPTSTTPLQSTMTTNPTESEVHQTMPEEVTGRPPPMYNAVYYNTVKELIEGPEGLLSDLMEEIAEYLEGDDVDGKFRKFVNRLRNGHLYVPYLNGKEIPFENSEIRSNIVMYPSEWYQHPWINFGADELQTGLISIGFLYLGEDIQAEASQKSGSWLSSQLDPNFPNVHNYKDYPHFKKIYDSTTKFDGNIVKTLNVEFNNNQADRIFFVYDEVLVKIVPSSDLSSEKWSKGLTFEKIPMNG